MIRVDVSHFYVRHRFSAVRHHRRVVLCECFSLFIFADSRQTLAASTAATHLCAGTEQQQVCSRLVKCVEKHAGTLTVRTLQSNTLMHTGVHGHI